jgi:hypothetical protein
MAIKATRKTVFASFLLRRNNIEVSTEPKTAIAKAALA